MIARLVRGYASLYAPDEDNAPKSPKLTVEQVREIRARYKPRRTTYAGIAREYGIALTTVKRIVTRKTWRHV